MLGVVWLVAAAVAPVQIATACDACNLTFADEVLVGDRADSVIAADLRRAMQNQKGLPVAGFSSGMLLALQEAKVVATAKPTTITTVSGPAPVPAMAATAAIAAPTVTSARPLPDSMKGADFIDIIERDYVRINFLNTGPNNLSTFHIVGILWDYIYWQGHPDAMLPGGQTVTAGPSDSFVIEFRMPPDKGTYTMLTHAVGSASRGAIGLLVVDDEAELAPHRTITATGPDFTTEEMATFIEEATRVIAPFGIGTHPVDRPVVHGADVKQIDISIIGNAYHPKVVSIAPGTEVRFTNEDVFTYLGGEFAGIHNAVAIKMPQGATGFVTPLLAHAESGSHVFETPGEYEYICAPHPYMKGKIIVREPSE